MVGEFDNAIAPDKVQVVSQTITVKYGEHLSLVVSAGALVYLDRITYDGKTAYVRYHCPMAPIDGLSFPIPVDVLTAYNAESKPNE